MRTSRQIFQENALESLAYADKYNEWIVSKFERYLGRNILELGAGLGNITLKIKGKGFKITPTEIDRHFLKHLKIINKEAFYLNILNKNSKLKEKFDTIIAVNVIEHIQDDNKVFKNIYNLLASNGMFVILVPAHQILFGSYDKLAGHYRRYSQEELTSKLVNTGFNVEKASYYNKLSAFGWFLNARILKRKEFNKSQMQFLNLLVPVLNIFDKLIPFNFGISLICVAKKQTSLKLVF